MKVMFRNGLKKYSVEVLDIKSKRSLEIKREELSKLVGKLHDLVDEYHHEVYLRDDFFNALGLMVSVLDDECNEEKIVKDLG